MSSYRFCRTDDIGLLVDALNRCWHPYVPDEPEMTVVRFKRDIRDIQVWCSSCMVAFAGPDPIGVMIGAKRPWGTLVHRVAVHPDHCRQGHGRHLLTSLGSKLSILGPPRIVAEVPGTAGRAHDLFAACGFTPDSPCTDFALDRAREPAQVPAPLPGRLVIPITVDDLVANGLLGESDPRVCWERAVETLTARKNEIGGLAIATDERIEAYLLHSADSSGTGADVLALRALVEDAGEARLRLLVARLVAQTQGPCRISKVYPDEIAWPLLADLDFRAAGVHSRFAATARPA